MAAETFAAIPEWVLDAPISDKAVRLFAVLARYADRHTRTAWPSRRELAARLHVADVKVVTRALADLVRIGAVTVTERARDDGGQTSNGYLLHDTPQGSRALPPQGSRAPGGEADEPLPPSELDEHPDPQGSGAPPPGLPSPAPQGSGAPPRTRAREREQQQPPPLLLPLGSAEERTPTAAELFDQWWASYPKKVGKDAARRAWGKACKRTDPLKILDVIARYPFREDRAYVKDPATWLNAGCWEDDLEAVAAAVAGSNGNGYGRRSSVAPELPPRDSYNTGRTQF